MAAEVVQADYEALDQISSTFGEMAAQNQQMVATIRQKVEALRSGWIGRGSDAFFAEMTQEVLPRLQKYCQALEEASETTRAVSQLIQDAEQQAANVIRSIQ